MGSVHQDRCVLGRRYTVLHHMVKASVQGTELTDFLPTAPLLNQISLKKIK